MPSHTASYLSAIYADRAAPGAGLQPDDTLRTFRGDPGQHMHGTAAGFSQAPGQPLNEPRGLPFIKQFSRSGRDDASAQPALMPLEAADDSGWGSWLQASTLSRPWRAAARFAGASESGARAQPGSMAADAAGRQLAGVAGGATRAFGASQNAAGGEMYLQGPDSADQDGGGSALAPQGGRDLRAEPALAFGSESAGYQAEAQIAQTTQCAPPTCCSTRSS